MMLNQSGYLISFLCVSPDVKMLEVDPNPITVALDLDLLLGLYCHYFVFLH